MKKERDLMDIIKEAQEEITEEDPVTKGNEILFGKDGGPPHMDSGPYEPDEVDYCPYCGKELEGGQHGGFCNEQCENQFFSESDIQKEELETLEQEERKSKCIP